jgi:DNA-binding response OmpR family regulator
MAIKVLTIDDDPAMTDLISMLLKTYNFEVFSANSGQSGIKLIHEQSPNIVLLDLMMPDMDGWQVCKAIREFSSVPIIILSALDNPSMVASALDAGADDYLIKPVPSGVLVAHVNRFVRRTTGSLSAPIASTHTGTDGKVAPALVARHNPIS